MVNPDDYLQGRLSAYKDAVAILVDALMDANAEGKDISELKLVLTQVEAEIKTTKEHNDYPGYAWTR